MLVGIEELRPGMMRAVGVHNFEGQTLLGPGVTLTEGYIGRLVTIAYQHHEHQHGEGYPRQFTGTNRLSRSLDGPFPGHIMPLAEIAAVADFYDGRVSAGMVRATSESRFNREVPELFLALMPPFLLGTRVVIEDGRWRGYTAVVAALDRLAPRRPVVRVIADEHGGRGAPHEIDLARELIPVSGFEARSRAFA